MKSPPLGTLSAEQFLNDYWQQQPCLIRAAYPDFKPLIDADELAGLACEAEVEARIVTQDQAGWQLLHGPFSEPDFAKLPSSHWTLMVQGVDQWLPEAATLMEDFNFIQRWRRDDLMVSYAVQGGGVGPHYDQYDVFLLQANGKRRWQIGEQFDEHSPRITPSPLLQLANWQPQKEWDLAPGDMLYLPPGIGHNGIALDNDCMTYSIGFRAPSIAEAAGGVADLAAEAYSEAQRYRDPTPSSDLNTGEINTDHISKLSEMLHQVANNQHLLRQWLGQQATQTNHNIPLLPNIGNNKNHQITKQLESHLYLRHALGTRFAYTEASDTNSAMLFVNGEVLNINAEQQNLMRLLGNEACINCKQIKTSKANLILINQLLALQSITFGN